ncbi:hypothetical protein HanXRQr2_Chr16g0724011 [Helianthus annuus]|uniref:Uncharacterized protein n=1 Tax=Helianthus annuus TaxID=4232 RepID=A0A9K3DLW5_HELAN|nr:hypothetical protein HanXRQr2_Chr16g0724011 [Helianthus annuus]
MRNKVVFEQAAVSVPMVVEEIKGMSFQWVKFRSKEACLTWDRWKFLTLFRICSSAHIILSILCYEFEVVTLVDVIMVLAPC